MSTPCNSLNVQLIKVSKLASYSSLKGRDIILTIQSGSSLYSRKSTLNDLISFFARNPSGSYSGSFSGSFKGKASGSFSGSFYGTATRSQTSSYLLQTNQNTTKGVGYYDGNRLTSAPGLVFDNNTGGVKSLSISSSLPFNYLNIASRGLTSGGTKYNQAGISLANYNSNEPYPTYDSWIILSATSGSLTFVAPIGSNAFSSSTIKAQSTTGECYGMVQRKNGFYFWPYMVSNTPARDGAIGIGVQPPNEATGSFDKYLRAKLQINMFSGSGEGPWSVPATVENRATAILINYGSGSATTGFTKTFFVSGSGNTYIHGKLNVNRGITGSFYGNAFKTLNGKAVSLWGTASHAVTASFVLGGGLTNGLGGLGANLFYTATSVSTISSYYNSVYSVTHGLGSSPSLIRSTLICNSSDAGYSVNDEVSVEQLHDDTGGADDERPITTVWTNSTQAGVAFAAWSSGIYLSAKTGGRTTLDTSKWNVKLRVWK
jgi:hypothetical protein